MSRRTGRRLRRHEDHQNHEAWAIPYGDLITLLLAFFVVMYAISSVNTGKYRVVSFSLSQALKGTHSGGAVGEGISGGIGPAEGLGVIDLSSHLRESAQDKPYQASPLSPPSAALQQPSPRTRRLHEIGEKIMTALGGLVDRGLVDVNISDEWVQVDLKSDILFASGVGDVAKSAEPVIGALAQVLVGFPNEVRVEGHTDDRPIRSVQFKSNWELSAARAASVVHLLTNSGVDARRLSVVAHAEQMPIRDNDTDAGRTANRRVVLQVLNSDYDLPFVPEPEGATTSTAATATATVASATAEGALNAAR